MTGLLASLCAVIANIRTEMRHDAACYEVRSHFDAENCTCDFEARVDAAIAARWAASIHSGAEMAAAPWAAALLSGDLQVVEDAALRAARAEP